MFCSISVNRHQLHRSADYVETDSPYIISCVRSLLLIMYHSFIVKITKKHMSLNVFIIFYLYKYLDKVQCYILQNSTLVQRVVRQGMVLFYTYICFDTYSKLSRYEVSTSSVLYLYIFMKKKRMMTMPETFSLPFINL